MVVFWYFKTSESLSFSPKTTIDEKLKELFQTEEQGKFSVVLHNDPINGMEYVVGVIKQVFRYSTAKAVWLMLKAHCTGKSILWIGSKKKAEIKRNKMCSFGPDPKMTHKWARTLTVTVEKYE